MGIRRGPNIIQSGLVLSLDAGNIRSYPGSGTAWKDVSGRNSTGTLTNGTGYSTGNKGTLVFDGSNDYVNLGTSAVFNQFATDFTVSAWANRSNSGPTFGNIIGDYYTNGVATTGEWQIMMTNGGAFNLYKVGPGYLISTTANFGGNTWHNLTVTRAGAGITMYVNSTSVATATDSNTFGTATGNVNIGVDGDNSSEPFGGSIAAVRIYNRALTASEILQNFNMTKTRFGL